MLDLRDLVFARRWACLLAWVLPFFASLALGEASASPVNAEDLRTDDSSDGWSGSVDANVAGSRGNVQRFNLGYGARVRFETHYDEGVGYGDLRPAPGAPHFFRDRWYLTASGAFGSAQGTTFLSRGYAHTRYTRMWIPRLGTEWFVQNQYDQLMRLRLRVLGGMGLRVVPLHRAVVRSWLGTGYMPEYEVNATEPGDPHPARVVNHRWTNYGVLELRPLGDDRLVWRNTAYLQPRLDAFADFRFLGNMQLEGRVTKAFAMGFEGLALYDSRPPLQVVRWDLSMGGYLRVRFG